MMQFRIENSFQKIFSSNPNYTGWPVWLDFRHNLNVNDHPKVISGVYEYLIVSTVRDFSSHIDFARFDPKGEFFLTRLLQDDGAPKVVEPGKVIDPILMILRVAEAMAVGIAFAKTLEWKPEETTLGFAFRWDNLKERRLTPWANQHLRIPGGGTTHDDSSRAAFSSLWTHLCPRSRNMSTKLPSICLPLLTAQQYRLTLLKDWLDSYLIES